LAVDRLTILARLLYIECDACITLCNHPDMSDSLHYMQISDVISNQLVEFERGHCSAHRLQNPKM